MPERYSPDIKPVAEREAIVRVRELVTPDGRRLQALVQNGASSDSLELVGFLGDDEKTTVEIPSADRSRWKDYFKDHLHEAGPAWDEFMAPYINTEAQDALDRFLQRRVQERAEYEEQKKRYAAEYAARNEEYPPFRSIYSPSPVVEEYKKYRQMLRDKNFGASENTKPLISALARAVSSGDKQAILKNLRQIGREIDVRASESIAHEPSEVLPHEYWLTLGNATGGQRLLLDTKEKEKRLYFPSQGNMLSRRYQQIVGRVFGTNARLADGIPRPGVDGDLEATYDVIIPL